ncbi:nucleotidyltransferase domain-containing protein, partial [Candidatus Bipolaricaulota bacterium]|nr:nucleotidyltransferase domain-containing protein [Candidatus Bipolaricaulota bacterium]
SGSRSWGVASSDSDYDVRFIYLHRPSWYLSIDVEAKRDVIDRPIEELLDIRGWDLRKTLQLFRKANPSLMEWLASPIVYLDISKTASTLRKLSKSYCPPEAIAYNNLNTARRRFRELSSSHLVLRKKYFYVLRPILAVNWMEKGCENVPADFKTLVSGIVPPGTLRDAITAVVKEKASGGEMTRGPRVSEIDDFVAAELERLENSPSDRAPSLPPVDTLNELFRQELREVYGGSENPDGLNNVWNETS